MAKRSPIAGYNHNVRYRGLIFHVQTEDSGLQSPHLFTHMFYGGVIISTRKLVYDAGASEDAIKGLMQSQHKVVLRDLKRGGFDDKIDQYLVGTEGLLPRGAGEDGEKSTAAIPLTNPADVPRASEPAMQVRLSEPEIILERPETDHDITPDMMEAVEPPPPLSSRAATPPPIPVRTKTPAAHAPAPARTITADRKSAPGRSRGGTSPPPPSDDLDPPTLNDRSDSIAAAIAAANAAARNDSDLHIRIDLDDDEPIELTRRTSRDTDIEMPDSRASTHSDGVPGQMGSSASSRGSAVGAATLPAARPISRPPTRQPISPPAVVSRPLTHEDIRARGDSDAIEIYAAAPSSGEPPPMERPGHYAQHKRGSQQMNSAEIVKGGADRSAPVPIPSGLSRPNKVSHAPQNVPGSGGIPQTQPMHTMPSGRGAPASQDSRRPSERARTPTPARVSVSTPATGRVNTSSSGGVVMTRPAVIVGAPAKPAAPRVRKAREEEGRGFGQGLISEKSLDEVILAYLSEDADDK